MEDYEYSITEVANAIPGIFLLLSVCRFSESKESERSSSRLLKWFYSELQNFQRLSVGFLVPKRISLRHFQLSFWQHEQRENVTLFIINFIAVNIKT